MEQQTMTTTDTATMSLRAAAKLAEESRHERADQRAIAAYTDSHPDTVNHPEHWHSIRDTITIALGVAHLAELDRIELHAALTAAYESQGAPTCGHRYDHIAESVKRAKWGASLVKPTAWSWDVLEGETVTAWFETEIPHAPSGKPRTVSVLESATEVEVMFGDEVLHNRGEVRALIEALLEVDAVLSVVGAGRSA